MNPPVQRGKANPRTRPESLRDWVLAGLGTGYSPWMPGTMGSLATALPLGLVPGSVTGVVICAVVALVASVLTLALLQHRSASQPSEGGKHDDPGWVVSDEVAGQAMAMVGAVVLAMRGEASMWVATAAAFVLFRIFDISKIGPVRTAERVGGPLGVLLDDVVAGALAAGLLVAAALFT